MRRHANRAGPLLRWIHESNRLSGRREIAKAYPCDRDRAIVRPVLRSFWQPRFVEDGQRRSKWPDRPPRVCVCMGKLSTRRTSTFAGSLRVANIDGLLRRPRTSHEESTRQQVWCMPSAQRQAVPSCDSKTLWAVRQQMPSSPLLQIYSTQYPPHPCLPVVLRALLIAFDYKNL